MWSSIHLAQEMEKKWNHIAYRSERCRRIKEK